MGNKILNNYKKIWVAGHNGMVGSAIVRKLVKEWKLTPKEVEDIIKEQEEFLTTWGKGEIV